MSIRSCRPP